MIPVYQLQIKILLKSMKMRYGGSCFQKNYTPMTSLEISDVFFDLDHTLWDFDRNSRLAFERVFQKHNIGLEVSDLEEGDMPMV